MAIDKRSQIRRLYALLITRVMNNFYGELIIKLEHGNVVFIKELKNLRPDPVTDSVQDLVKEYLENDTYDDSLELSIKKVKGKPHISVVNKGNISQIVTVDLLEEAERYRSKT